MIRNKPKALEDDEEPAPFTISGGVLRADQDLYWEWLEDFERLCNRLLKARSQRLTVDLTAVNFISSSYVGCLGNLILKASRLKKRVLLRVPEDVCWLFETMESQKVMDMEVV